jgi:hypothetical protein
MKRSERVLFYTIWIDDRKMLPEPLPVFADHLYDLFGFCFLVELPRESPYPNDPKAGLFFLQCVIAIIFIERYHQGLLFKCKAQDGSVWESSTSLSQPDYLMLL